MSAISFGLLFVAMFTSHDKHGAAFWPLVIFLVTTGFAIYSSIKAAATK